MKKRLSEPTKIVPIIGTVFLGTILIFSYSMSAVTTPWDYGQVVAEIPIASVPPLDEAAHGYSESPTHFVRATTPVVVLNEEGFFFGELAALTERRADIRQTFSLPHAEGSPRLADLLTTLRLWNEERGKTGHLDRDRIVVLLPTGVIPMPIVIQTLAALSKSALFDRVVLGGGML